MQTWFKTCRTAAPPLAVTLVNSLAVVILAIVLLGSSALSQSDSVRLEMSAVELARKVVTNELKVQEEERYHWRYRLEKEESGKKQVQELLETVVLSVNFSPLMATHLTPNSRGKRTSACRGSSAIQMSNGNYSR
jgi:hypothetical protein